MLLLCICLAAGDLARGQNIQERDSKAATIHGTVVNGVTHEVVSRALVTSQDNRFATMTDGEGHFEFAVPAATTTDPSDGTVSAQAVIRPDIFMARKPGFLEGPNRQVQHLSAENELTISLTPEALITGRAILPSPEDSGKIEVEVYRQQMEEGHAHWTSVSTVITRSNGEFRFADLAPGTYKLLTHELLDRDPLTFDPLGQLYGYPPVYFPNAGDFASAQAIQLSLGQVFHANISLVRRAYYRVKIPVVNGQADAMDVNVYAQGRGPGYSLGYDPQEQAITGMLPDGNYNVEASSFGPNPQTGLLNINVRGAALQGSRMTLATNGSINVEVKEEFTGSGPPGSGDSNGDSSGRVGKRFFNLLLEPADDFTPQRPAFLANPTGREDSPPLIEHVQPGRYWVRVHSWHGYISQISSGGVDLRLQPLVVGIGGSAASIEITMRDDGGSLDGTVEGIQTLPSKSATSPLRFGLRPSDSPAHVYLVSSSERNGEFREMLTSQDGKFSFQQVPPGDYRVLAFDREQPDLEYRNPEAMRAYETKGHAVTVVAGQKEQLQLQVISTSE